MGMKANLLRYDLFCFCHLLMVTVLSSPVTDLTSKYAKDNDHALRSFIDGCLCSYIVCRENSGITMCVTDYFGP